MITAFLEAIRYCLVSNNMFCTVQVHHSLWLMESHIKTSRVCSGSDYAEIFVDAASVSVVNSQD